VRSELQSERLRLRQWRPEDRAPFAAMNANPQVMRCFPAPLDRSASDAMADRIERLIAERGWGFWAAEHKDSGQFIGFIGLHEEPDQFTFSPCVEVGWRLAHDWWGKGLATEGGRAALHFAFGELKLPEIVSFTAAANLRSRAVMQRLGMREAGTFEHPALEPGHPLRRHWLYRIGPLGARSDSG
jgi:RimJ/RimL family protein N-acetyltransferase